MTPTQLALDLGLITVHCFFCPCSVTSNDSTTAHAQMELHYALKHRPDIQRLL